MSGTRPGVVPPEPRTIGALPSSPAVLETDLLPVVQMEGGQQVTRGAPVAQVLDRADERARPIARTYAQIGAKGTYPLEWFAGEHPDRTGGATLATDARRVIQAALDWQSEQNDGKPAGEQFRMQLGAGLYRLDQAASLAEWPANSSAEGRKALRVRNWTHLSLSTETRIEGAFSTTGGWGLVTVEDVEAARAGTNRPHHVTIEGGCWGKQGTASGIYGVSPWLGNIFSLWADDLTLTATRVEIYGGTGNGRAYLFYGDNQRITDPAFFYPPDAAGTGGIMRSGGRGFWCRGATGISGDDALILGPSPSGGWIEDAWFIGGMVRSLRARMFVASVRDPIKEAVQVSGIRTARFVDIGSLGPSANCGLIANQAGTLGFDDIAVRNITCELRDLDDASNPYALDIELHNSISGVAIPPTGLVAVEGVTLRGLRRGALRVRGNIAKFSVDGLRADRPAYAGTNLVRLQGLRKWRLSDLDLTMHPDSVGATAHAIQVDVATAPAVDTFPHGCGDGVIADSIVRGVPSGMVAVNLARTEAWNVEGLTVLPAEGATAAGALGIAAAARGGRVATSDFTAVGAVPIVNAGGALIEDTNRLPAGMAVSPVTRLAAVSHGPGRRPLSYYPSAGMMEYAQVGATDLLMLHWVRLDDDIDVGAIWLRASVAQAGSAYKAGIWAGLGGVPTGLPLLADNTGWPTDVSGIRGAVLAATTRLARGGVFVGTLWTGATRPTVSAMAPTSMEQYRAIGASGAGGRLPTNMALQMAGLSVAVPYETDIAALDLTGQAFIPYIGAGMPVVELRNG